MIILISALFSGINGEPLRFGFQKNGNKISEQFSSIRLQDDLVVHWTFDEKTGNVIYDSSGNNFHSNLVDGTRISGPRAGAIRFDGIDDYIETTSEASELFSHLETLGEGTISLWFKCDYIPTVHGIAPIFYYGSKSPCENMFDASNQGLIIEAGHSPIHPGSKRLYFTIFANGCSYPSFCYDSWKPLTETVWYHYAAVVGPDYNTGYLNGIEMVDRHYNFGNPSYSQFFADAMKHEALWMGKAYWDAEEDPSPIYLDGSVDDLRIYNRALTGDEIQYLYTNMSPSNHTLYIDSGWNLLTVPVQNNWTAETLGQNITTSTAVSTYNASTHLFNTHVVGTPHNNFPILDGNGYYVYATETTTINVTGMAIQNVNITLSPHWNLLGWYTNETATAEDLGQTIEGCTLVAKYDATTQKFLSHVVGVQHDNFTLQQGMGIFIYTTQPGQWDDIG